MTELQAHPSIPEWTHFRYDILPNGMAPHRKTLERIVIRYFASVLANEKGVDSFPISQYPPANEKID